MPFSERSWARAGLDEAAYSALAKGMAASQLWSVLLGVAEQRAAQRTPAHVRQQWERDRFVCPSYMDQRTLNELDSARCTSGEHIPLIDGGSFDWLRTLTSNHKFIFVASAMGSQLAAYLYRPLIA